MPPSFTKNFICLEKFYSFRKISFLHKHDAHLYTETIQNPVLHAQKEVYNSCSVQLIIKRLEPDHKIICIGLYLNPGNPGDVYAGVWGYCALLTAGATGGFFAILTPRAVPLGVSFIYKYLSWFPTLQVDFTCAHLRTL